jgi:type II secretory pathway pseudopilin PulG
MSTADELVKLDALRKSGVLTQEEFETEKAKLLGGASPLAESGSSSGAESSQGAVWWRASDGKWYPPPAPTSTPVEASTPLPPTVQTQPISSEPTTAPGVEERRSNTSLLVVIGIVVVVGIAVGAFLLLKGSASKSRSADNTAAQANLQTALTGADTFYTADNQTYTGIYGGSGVSTITAIDTGLSYVPSPTASTDASTISIRESAGATLELTAYAPASGICWGVLDMKASTDSPVFPDYPSTTTTGTYYFSSQQSSAGNCGANITNPDLLSANGW